MDNTEIFGCFFKIGFDPQLSEREFINLADQFRIYIWSEKGIDGKLKKLKNENYGRDLNLVLFQFYVKPTESELQYLKEIESYRKKEKSIGIPIIVTDENFFAKTEEERYEFLKSSIMQKMDLLEVVVKRRKLDTNMKQLKLDLDKILVFP